MTKPYSVLLKYPDDGGELATYYTHVEAETPEAALAVARQSASDCNADTAPEDFQCLAVIAGHHELELDCWCED